MSDSSDQLFTTLCTESDPQYSSGQRKTIAKRDLTSVRCSSSINQQQESEYTLTLKNALVQAVDENDLLRSRVLELEALLAAAQDEIEQKDKAIIELANLIEVTDSAMRNVNCNRIKVQITSEKLGEAMRDANAS